MNDQELTLAIAKALDDKKALDIVALKVDHLTVICDYMVIASGRTANQVHALADEVEDQMAAAGLTLRRIEGQNEARWIVMDFGRILVHLFSREERAYYKLERLWDDGTNRLDLSFLTEEN
ncbi:MAG: ribosome silencing factor [Clostridia bacterium]|nr:ribosome silencing factor [Clostridia bacterium]